MVGQKLKLRNEINTKTINFLLMSIKDDAKVREGCLIETFNPGWTQISIKSGNESKETAQKDFFNNGKTVTFSKLGTSSQSARDLVQNLHLKIINPNLKNQGISEDFFKAMEIKNDELRTFLEKSVELDVKYSKRENIIEINQESIFEDEFYYPVHEDDLIDDEEDELKKDIKNGVIDSKEI